ncbi:hypothetical protein WR25_00355 [Diploscapter pachys]|uniref:Uncharacterized protein n=1 Tax=Diploscapter pachys TaxID=2018661 RepID=A0A2A2JYJ3_9BILA|nr:hypothetical protein WR25_00355 [Diploscapter pachys]
MTCPYSLLIVLFRFCLFILVYCTVEDAPSSLPQFANKLINEFEHQSRVNIVEEAFEPVKKRLRVQSEYPRAVLEQARQHLDELFGNRVTALKASHLFPHLLPHSPSRYAFPRSFHPTKI